MKRLVLICTLLLGLAPSQVLAQSSPRHYLSAASSNNPTLVFSKRAILATAQGLNTGAATVYLKIYDKATQPVCGTDVPILTVPLPQNVPNGYSEPSLIVNGVGICITGAIADNDATFVPAGVAVNIGVSGR